MTKRKLKYSHRVFLDAIAKHKSVAAAARALNLSPNTIKRYFVRLEEDDPLRVEYHKLVIPIHTKTPLKYESFKERKRAQMLRYTRKRRERDREDAKINSEKAC